MRRFNKFRFFFPREFWIKELKKQQDIYGFLVKNLDLDSNLYNLEKLIKKAS